MKVIDNIFEKLNFFESDDEGENVSSRDSGHTVVGNTVQKPEPVVQAMKGPKVVSIHQNSQFKMVVVQPNNLEDAKEICDYLKDKKPVVVNIDIEGIQSEMPQRILDFLSGCVYALDGSIETVTKGIYVVVPNNVDITNQIR